MKQPPYYSTIVLFGREQERSILHGDQFADLVNTLADIVRGAGCTAKSRGIIEGAKGRNVAPRKGTWDGKMLPRWKESMSLGRFKQFELFDSEWSEDHFPAAYAAINKMWGYGPDGYTERTADGAESNVTVALRRDVVADRMAQMEDHARLLAGMISAFYGFLEFEVQWDRETTPGGLRTDMVDLRWYNRSSGDYKRGTYRMDEALSRLYWGNVLSVAHLRGRALEELPGWAVARSEEWEGGLSYIRFSRDPQEDREFARMLEPYFNLLPHDGVPG